jgi:hypothetical protein
MSRRGTEAAGNFRNSRNFRRRTANQHRVDTPAQGGAAAGMVGRGVAEMKS